MKRYMIIAVPMTEWAWLKDVLEPNEETGILEPTGRQTMEHGIFWDWIHNNIDTSIITPSFKRLIDEHPKIMIKDGAEWGVIIISTERFALPDYDTWAVGMLTKAMTEGITILGTTVEDLPIIGAGKSTKQEWFEANGLIEPASGE